MRPHTSQTKGGNKLSPFEFVDFQLVRRRCLCRAKHVGKSPTWTSLRTDTKPRKGGGGRYQLIPRGQRRLVEAGRGRLWRPREIAR